MIAADLSASISRMPELSGAPIDQVLSRTSATSSSPLMPRTASDVALTWAVETPTKGAKESAIVPETVTRTTPVCLA